VHAQYEKTPWPSTQKVPPFLFKDANGREYKLENLRGKKVVLNFWATWCAPCKEELPSLQIFSDLQNPEQVLVMTINVKEPPGRAQRFMQNNQISLPLISDAQGEWAQKFGVKVYPTSLLLDTKGQIRWRIMGEVDWTSAEPQAWVNSLP
jgi:thiol-disulfide isomerase/thioredoxin